MIDNLDTVCLFLGPNRNLTTLTASILSLHPNCQVMSHGGERVLPMDNLNFLNNYTNEKFIEFCHFALTMSQTHGKGGFGGSITITHAFRHNRRIRRAFQRRFGRSLIKRPVKSLIWKEAQRVDNYIEQTNADLTIILSKNDKLRFIMPVRNPIQVARSLMHNEGFKKKYYDDAASIYPILDNILLKMKRTIELHRRFPDRFFIFFENEINIELLTEIAKFLRIPVDSKWLLDASQCFELNSKKYFFPDSIHEYFEERTKTLFEKNPSILYKFHQYFRK
jgi:hypothetical protein